jgi:hypothetical protein
MATCATFQTTQLKQQLAYLTPTWKNASIIGQFHAKGQTMKNTILDILTAIGLGLMLCVGLLAYFDVLVK